MLVLVTGGGGFVGQPPGPRVSWPGATASAASCAGPAIPEGLAGLPVEIVVGDVTRPASLAGGPRRASTRSTTWRRGSRPCREREMLRDERARHLQPGGGRLRRPDASRGSSTARAWRSAGRATGRPAVTEAAPYRPVTWYGALEGARRADRARVGGAGAARRRRPPARRVRPSGSRAPLRLPDASSKGVRPLLGPQPKTYSWVLRGRPGRRARRASAAIPARSGGPSSRPTRRRPPWSGSSTSRSRPSGVGRARVRLPVSLVRVLAGRGRPPRAGDRHARDADARQGERARADGLGLLGRMPRRETLGWRARTPLESGVPGRPRWYREQGWHLT